MVEVWIPMLDGRWLVLPRHTQPEPDVQALLEQTRITLPPQPPPRINRRKCRRLQLAGLIRKAERNRRYNMAGAGIEDARRGCL